MWTVDAVFKTPGVGGALACVVVVTLTACYYLTIKWILKGREDETQRH